MAFEQYRPSTSSTGTPRLSKLTALHSPGAKLLGCRGETLEAFVLTGQKTDRCSPTDCVFEGV